MELPKVSILIPTYNQQAFIDKAIKSALSQDYKNLEVILADDHSSDGSLAIIQQYKGNSRFKYFRNDSNCGRVANYKKALYDYATGDWTLCLDGDDYLTDSTYVSSCIELVNKFEFQGKKIVFIQAGDKLINNNKNDEITRLPKIPSECLFLSGLEYFFTFTRFAHFSHLATIYDRHLAMRIGFYNHDVLSSDMESVLKLSLHGDVLLIKKVVGVWLHHDSNASNTGNVEVQLNNLTWLAQCRSYGANLFPHLQQRFEQWYEKHVVFYMHSILILLRKSNKSGHDLIKENKTIITYGWQNHRFIFLSFKSILHFLIIFLIGVKRIIFNSNVSNLK